MITWVDYDGNTYGEYEFPAWANAVGWMITFSSVILIPIVAIIKIYNEEGTLSYVSEIFFLITLAWDWLSIKLSNSFHNTDPYFS